MWERIDKFSNRLTGLGDSCLYGLVLSGGGARAAYQAGVMQYISDSFPEQQFPIMTGVSAGSLNVAHLANNTAGLRPAVSDLVAWWEKLTSDDVYRAESGFQLFWNAVTKFGDDDDSADESGRGMVDTEPLRRFLRKNLNADDGRLSGITANIRLGRLNACALVTTNYATGQSVTWVEGDQIEGWERPNRISIQGPLTIDHIMASSALPGLFPAIKLGDMWYGDGGIRLAEPLSPAIHLRADRILAISTRYGRSRREADDPAVIGYPPSAQIFGTLLNAVFLDHLDQDALSVARINSLLRSLPPWRRKGMRIVNLLVIRPSVDLGRLAGEFQSDLGGALNLLARGLRSKDTKSPDWLSMLLFEPDYSTRLMEIGYDDARNQKERLERFFDPRKRWSDVC